MSSIITTSREFRADVLRNDKAMLRQLSQAYSLIDKSLNRQLKELMRDIQKAQREGKTVNQDWLRRSFRYQQLIRQVKGQVGGFSFNVNQFIQAQQRRAIDLGQFHAQQLIESADVGISFARLPTGAIEELVGVMQNGSPLNKTLEKFGPQVAKEIRETLITGLGSGHGAAKIARGIRQSIDIPRWKALQISRSEVLRAYRQSSLKTFSENSDVLDGWIWTASLSSRSCLACIALHGTFFPLSKTFFPAHVSCFPAGTLVTGPGVRATSTRWYEGELIDLEFASGKTLSVTPNHPILTAHGWVAAGLLDEGSNVVRSLDGEATASLVDPDDYQVPTLIENVSNARFGGSSMVAVSVPTSPEDFHGDGRGSDVSVIRTNRELWDAVTDSTFAEHLREPQLVWRRVGLSLLSRFGASDLFVKGLLSVGRRDVRSGDVSSVLFRRSLCHHHAVGLGAAASRDPRTSQPIGNDSSSNSELTGQSVLGLASQIAVNNLIVRQSGLSAERSTHPLSGESVSSGLVSEQPSSLQLIAETLLANSELGSQTLSAFASNISFDRVLKVSRRAFSGHVYNLETKTGWYIANGILTHNCRCTAIPSVKNTKINMQSGSEYVAGLSQDQQINLMGPSRYEMYSSGTALDDFVTLTRDKDWGGAYQVRPLWKMRQKKKAA